MESIRKPSSQELRLIKFLVCRAVKPLPANWESDLMVQPMQDGGMGSLTLFRHGYAVGKREFGEWSSEYQFLDSDGVSDIASLNLDNNGELFELDMWFKLAIAHVVFLHLPVFHIIKMFNLSLPKKPRTRLVLAYYRPWIRLNRPLIRFIPASPWPCPRLYRH
ncbi:DUF6984 family protein [Chitinophaga cymbidii]|uniref:DUF6984 family protein n=1 Tax=Chitinophaga cymbidii TaxID=1096750 RepID=UPI003530D40E